jgi:hypothetical protein
MSQLDGVARMERSAIRGSAFQHILLSLDYASLHPGYRLAPYLIATGLIMLCTPPLKRGWPSTNMNS